MDTATPDSTPASSHPLPNGDAVTPEGNLETVSCCLEITLRVDVSRVHFRAAPCVAMPQWPERLAPSRFSEQNKDVDPTA